MSKPQEQLVIGGLYEHYKSETGNLKRYKVLGVVRHSETLEELVYYEALYPNELGAFWVRPKEMFVSHVVIDGESRPRFRYVGL